MLEAYVITNNLKSQMKFKFMDPITWSSLTRVRRLAYLKQEHAKYMIDMIDEMLQETVGIEQRVHLESDSMTHKKAVEHRHLLFRVSQLQCMIQDAQKWEKKIRTEGWKIHKWRRANEYHWTLQACAAKLENTIQGVQQERQGYQELLLDSTKPSPD